MLGLYVSVPIACWRKGHAREYLESERLPPPSTCYGFLLSLVGEQDRERHLGVRVTAGLVNREGPGQGVVLRTLWRVKDKKQLPGVGTNARPDFQMLYTNAELVIWCDSSDEEDEGTSLENRVRHALLDPGSVERFGGLSLGESTHLVNDVRLLREGDLHEEALTFVVQADGRMTLPVWVDHVGSAGTRHVTGILKRGQTPPQLADLPQIHQ